MIQRQPLVREAAFWPTPLRLPINSSRLLLGSLLRQGGFRPAILPCTACHSHTMWGGVSGLLAKSMRHAVHVHLFVKSLINTCICIIPWIWQHSRKDVISACVHRIALESAAGRISAELLCPYPPGIPLVFPGERILAQDIKELKAVLAQNGRVKGPSNASMRSVQVVMQHTDT